jgi:4-hydroxyproline epimerase
MDLDLRNLAQLTQYSARVRKALIANNITGEDGAEIDHIELFSPTPSADSRNFVLCPGIEYDRSPCGTGTSAKLACLYADGKITEGQVWRQESITGTIFEGRIRRRSTLSWIRMIRFVSESTNELRRRDRRGGDRWCCLCR